MGGDLTQVLRRPVELAVISGHFAMRERYPLYPQKRTALRLSGGQWPGSGGRPPCRAAPGDG